MPYVVFAQVDELPLAALLANARRHFELSVEVLSRDEASRSSALSITHGATTGTFSVAVRPNTAEAIVSARAAEQRGRAGGMGDLAARCRAVWTVTSDAAAPEWLTLELTALLASVALGPILPPDRSTLFGVRGARERAALRRGEPHA